MGSVFTGDAGCISRCKTDMMWNNRIVLGREGCAVQMDTFADMLRSTAKELEKSLFSDERLEKKAGISFKKREGFVYCTAVFS